MVSYGNSYSSTQSSAIVSTVHGRHSAIPKEASTMAHLGSLPSSSPLPHFFVMSSFSFCGLCFLYGTTSSFNHPLQPIYMIAFLSVPSVVIGLLHQRVFSAGLPVKNLYMPREIFAALPSRTVIMATKL